MKLENVVRKFKELWNRSRHLLDYGLLWLNEENEETSLLTLTISSFTKILNNNFTELKMQRSVSVRLVKVSPTCYFN